MKTLAEFEDVIKALEMVAWRPEAITDGQTSQPTSLGGGFQPNLSFQFQPFDVGD
jgi:hypothetical protein